MGRKMNLTCNRCGKVITRHLGYWEGLCIECAARSRLVAGGRRFKEIYAPLRLELRPEEFERLVELRTSQGFKDSLRGLNGKRRRRARSGKIKLL